MKVLAAIAFAIISPLLGGWLLSSAWGWFIVPTFGASPLTRPAAIGLWVFVGIFLGYSNIPLLVNANSQCKHLKDADRSLIVSMIGAIYCLVMFGACWMWSQVLS